MASFLCWLGLSLGPPKTNMSLCLRQPSPDFVAVDEKEDIAKGQNMDAKQTMADAITEEILLIHSDLLELGGNYQPGPQINGALTKLVTLCSRIRDQNTVAQVLNDASVRDVLPGLRSICSQAEAALELHWAEKVVRESSDAQAAFEMLTTEFLYYHNYEELTRLELCAVFSATSSPPRRIAFIGSGPLPLTSLCLLAALKNKSDSLIMSMATNSPDGPSTTVLNIDHNRSAIDSSQKLCQTLGTRGNGMEFTCEDATAPTDLSEFDVVYVAALVGETQDAKEDILLSVARRMKPGALMVIRSAWGLRTCLYAEVDTATTRLAERLETCVVMHPYGQVVNSVIIAQVRG